MSKKLRILNGIPRSAKDLGLVEVIGGGTIGYTAPPTVERSLETDGTGTNGNDATVPYNATYFNQTNNISIFCWMKIRNPHPSSNCGVFCQMGSSGNYKWTIQAEPNPVGGDPTYLRCYVTSDGTSTASTAKLYLDTTIDLNDGKWHHVGFTFTTNTFKIYIDGQQIADQDLNKVWDPTVNSLYPSTAELSMGSLGIPNFHRPLDGWTNSFSYWNKELTAAEVLELYNNGAFLDAKSHSAAANLVEFWPMDTATNASGSNITGVVNGNNATLNGTATISTTEAPPTLAELAFTNPLQVEVPGLALADNNIPTTESPIQLLENEVAYVTLNEASGGGNLSISKGTSDNVPTTATLIARRDGPYIKLGTSKYPEDITPYFTYITEWEPMSPVFNNGGGWTFTNTGWEWRQVGQNIEIRGTTAVSGSGSGASTFSVDMPLDNITTTLNRPHGIVTTYDINNVNVYQTSGVIANSTTTFSFVSYQDGSFISASDFVSGTELHFEINAPIAEWSAGNALSNNKLAQEMVRVYGVGNSSTVLTALTTKIDFSQTTDTHNVWDGSTFTAPYDRHYKVTGVVAVNSATVFDIYSYIDNSQDKLVGFTDADARLFNRFTWEGFLFKGQTLDFRSSAGATLSNSSSGHWISITSDPNFTTYGVVNPNTELVEAVTSTNHVVSTPSPDTWYTPSTAFSITLDEGTWDIGALINAHCIASASVVLSQCAIATSSTPGTGQLEVSIGSVGSDGSSFARKAIHQMVLNDYVVSPGTTVTLYIHLRALSIGGGTSLSALQLGSFYSSNSKLWARRVK